MISRLAYHQGIVIAVCPGCESKHLISDKTGLLDYGVWDVERLVERGERVARLGANGFRQLLSTMAEGLPHADGGNEASSSRAAGLRVLLEGSATPLANSAEAENPLLVRNSGSLIEAILEAHVSISTAVEFLCEEEDVESGADDSCS